MNHTFVCDHILALVPGDQHLSLSDVVLLSWGQLESQWIAKSVHAHVNLGAESSTASAEGLRWCPPLFGCARSALVSPDDRTVDDEVFHVRFLNEMLVHSLPDAPVAPSGKAFVDGVPLAVLAD